MPLTVDTSEEEAPSNLLANTPNTERAIMRNRDSAGLPQRPTVVNPDTHHSHSLVFLLALLLLGAAIVYRLYQR